ncbi:MAG: glycosyltransferase [Cytophagales bacterium]|nr:glycosyltransferase [Cytophagales bacterium]
MLTTYLVLAWTILAVQGIYLSCLLFAFRRKNDPAKRNAPPISIIVCAHDEFENVKTLVPLLLDQDYDDFEVIVVEDRSNDDTYDYLLQATKVHDKLRMVKVKFLPEHITGKKYALTLGLKAARHAWVLLTDADCRPAGKQWLRSMASHAGEDKKIVLGYSPYAKNSGYLNAFVRFESLITGIQFMGWAMLGSPYMGTGRNLAYRKALFLETKGFNKHLGVMGGDDDLFVNQHATSANTTVCMGADSLVRSIPKDTWRTFLYQKVRHLSVGKRYRLGDQLRLGVFSITWVGTWLFVLPIMFQPLPLTPWLWSGFIVRQILLETLVRRASRKLGDAFEAWKTPLLDFNYAIYYLGTGLVALVSKRIRWKI